ncbi:MAG: hypothetical protein HN416_13620, partial [Nitrospina sp.]|nr:hypothetical protein [Nitrospina sp.]
MAKRQRGSQWAIRPLVPEAVYTDREEYLDYLYKAALEAIGRRTMSTVLLGQRRMGKTEIFKRVVNRLFFDQENPADLDHSVVPVYFSFPDTVVDRWDFSLRYVENFIRWYVAFRAGDPDLVTGSDVLFEDVKKIAFKRVEMTDGLKGAFNLHGGIKRKVVVIPEEQAVMLPRGVSDRDETSIVMFLDEFQNTRLPQYDFDIVGWMQQAVESPTCPHFVTGSAMSILAREILGRGALFGRFESHPIEAITAYWGTELALRSATYRSADIREEMASVVAERCGGNPFYINAVVSQAAKQKKPIYSEEDLNGLLAVDLSSGFIWGELSDQVNRWIERINTSGITKAVLYLSALEEEDRLDLEHIRKEVQHREGIDVSMEEIRDVLVKLSRGDLLEYMELGGWFRKAQDPILLEFLKVWGRIEVDARDASQVQNELVTRYRKQKRRFHEYKGYLAEVFMSQVLWAAQDQTLPGHFFHFSEDVSFPRFIFVRQRMRLGSGKGREIDVVGAGGGYNWVCQSKWIKGKKV